MMKNENMKFFYSFLLIICVYMDFVQGTSTSRKLHGNQGGCLSYGHSCWGGHGKRGGPPRVLRPPPLYKIEIPERWEFIKTLPERQNGAAYSLYPDLNRKHFKDADSDEKFITNALQQPSDNFPFLQSLSSNNEIDSFSKEAETKPHQRNNNNKIGLIKQNHQSLNSNTNNNQGLDSYEDLSSSISVLSNGVVSDSELQNIPIDDIIEMKNMKILKMLTKPYETKLLP